MMAKAKRIPFLSADQSADIASQVVLPFSKSLEISVKSLKVRLFRNLLTVMSLVLAVSFFSFVVTGLDVARGLAESGDPALAKALLRAGYDLDPEAGVGATAKERWVVVLSLLVCTVGIVNAQLMAVTERFREIGTMKCLGALDSFILRLFLLESFMQGAAGSVAGTLLGTVGALLFGLIRFGTAAVVHLPAGGFLSTLCLSIAVGMGLTMAGVVYPAVVAARMRPVEAMRTEQ